MLNKSSISGHIEPVVQAKTERNGHTGQLWRYSTYNQDQRTLRHYSYLTETIVHSIHTYMHSENVHWIWHGHQSLHLHDFINITLAFMAAFVIMRKASMKNHRHHSCLATVNWSHCVSASERVRWLSLVEWMHFDYLSFKSKCFVS